MDVVLDRKQLYQEVWSMTVSAVARKYNLTDYDIRKACFALDVPTPVQGHWAKVRAADAPPVPPLPRKSGASTYTCTPTARAPRTPSNQPKAKKLVKEKESLVDWALRGRAEMQAKEAARPRPAPRNSMHLLPEDTIGLPRYIPLTVWGDLLLGEHAPHYNTLLRWVHEGFIQPQPVKIGRKWCVRKDAAYIPDQWAPQRRSRLSAA
jgi:hypothetical protein